jgi:hypothetical protein
LPILMAKVVSHIPVSLFPSNGKILNYNSQNVGVRICEFSDIKIVHLNFSLHLTKK